MSDKLKSYTLVSIQMISLILIFISGSPTAKYSLWLIMEVAGIVLGVWAFITMGWRNMNISPMVKEGARLVTKGPYRLIRHPMYLALLLIIWPLIIDQYSAFRLIAAIILTANLVVKMFYEEHLLRKHFAGYELYMRTTYRLIPFVLYTSLLLATD